MTENELIEPGVPEWYIRTLGAVETIDRSLRRLEDEVIEAIAIEAMDERVRMQMENLLDALRDIDSSLILVDMMARDVLDQVSTEAA